MSSYVRNEIVHWLLTHSYGQGGTVALPTSGTPDPLVLGDFPPGIEDVLQHITSRHTGWSPAATEIDWCFLVGGPGNGKSEALRSLARRLGIVLPSRGPGDPVPRTIPIGWPAEADRLANSLELAFVNDASIPRQDVAAVESSPGSLFHDIADALGRTARGKPTSLFVNVNRGILVEESGALRAVADWSTEPLEGRLAASMIRWLSAPSENADGSLDNVLQPTSERPHYGQFTVRLVTESKHPVGICVRVVFLDMLSLLEPIPGAGGRVVDFSAPLPEVAQYLTLGRLVSSDMTRDNTVAGGLVTMYADAPRWEGGGCRDAVSGQVCSAYDLCPFTQNSVWLREPALRHRFLDTLRAAEIAATRRLTYRDLLGHVSLAIMGTAEEEWLAGTHPCQWVADTHQRLGSGAGEKTVTVRLARHRIYTNIYPGGGFLVTRDVADARLKDSVFGAIIDLLVPSGDAARLQPFEKAFADIDPALDTESWDGLRKRVMDAVESLDIVSPAEQVVSWVEIPQAASSEIEKQLDRVLREEIAAELPKGTRAAVSRVRVLRRWRAVMVLRQVGTALGHVRYAEAIGAWLAEQASALLGGQRLPLGDGINNLIIPAAGGKKVFTAPLRPRTYCLTGDLPSETLLVTVQPNELDVQVVAQGDALIAEVRMRHRGASTEPLATLAVDLAVARESLLHADGTTNAFTEIGDTAFARIERARASLISRGRLRRINAWFTDEKGDAFQLVPSPTGTAALRVQPG
ncbi:MAG: hypothetical protein ACREK6_00195 [Candidatus Rokuibacteriota bacterium]